MANAIAVVGDSGSGKSTILKVIALFRWIFKMVSIRSYLKQSGITSSPFTFDFKEYLKNLIPNSVEDFLKEVKNLRSTMPKGRERMQFLDKKAKDYIKSWEK